MFSDKKTVKNNYIKETYTIEKNVLAARNFLTHLFIFVREKMTIFRRHHSLERG